MEICGTQQKFKKLIFIFVHVQSHIFKTVWLVWNIFLQKLSKVKGILNQKLNREYDGHIFRYGR